MSVTGTATLADVCVVACAEAWRGDGEILASPMLTVPTLGARLAALTFEPDLMLSDGEALLLGRPPALGAPDGDRLVEGWIPFRSVFDVVWSGRRHVMMSPTQLGPDGDANISCIGDWARPTRQLLGARGAPGNTVSHPTSYWVPRHSTRVFVPRVDFVAGVGYARAAAVGGAVARAHEIRRVVSNLGVFDFPAPQRVLRLVSVHPGVTVDDVVTATGFPLQAPDRVPETRLPTAEELKLIAELDPAGLRHKEVPG